MVNNYCFCFVSLTSGLHVCTITGHVTSRLMVRGLSAVHLIRKGGIWLVRGRYIEVVLCGRTHWLSRLKPLLLLLLLICQFCECLKDTGNWKLRLWIQRAYFIRTRTVHRQLLPAVLVTTDDARQVAPQSWQVDGSQREVCLSFIAVSVATAAVSLHWLHSYSSTSC